MKYPKRRTFSARGDKCPICRKDFRYGCDHSIAEAEAQIERNYMAAVVRYELAKARKKGDKE